MDLLIYFISCQHPHQHPATTALTPGTRTSHPKQTQQTMPDHAYATGRWSGV